MSVTFKKIDPTITAPYIEMPGSPTIEGQWGELTARRTLQCTQSAVARVIKEHMGGMRNTAPDGGTPFIEITRPHFVRLEDYGNVAVADFPKAFCRRFSIKPFQGDFPDTLKVGDAPRKIDQPILDIEKSSVKITGYPTVLLELEYGPLKLYDEKYEESAEHVTLSNVGLFWNTQQREPLANIEAPGRIAITGTWEINIPALPCNLPDLDNLVGKVNTDQVDSQRIKGLSFAAGTLLGLAPSKKSEQPDGFERPYVSLSYRFAYRRDLWNMFWRRGEDETQLVYDKDGAIFKPYPQTEFTELSLLLAGLKL